MPEGTVIDNKCYIFFDYNPPIITNTATTTFEVDQSDLVENEINQLIVYPNPITGAFTFYLPNEAENGSCVLIYNIAGEQVVEYLFDSSGFVTLDLSTEKTGVYFMTVQSGDKVTTR